MELQTGLKAEKKVKVSIGNTANSMGSGLLDVFATPSMIALMEGAAVQALQPYGVSSVGISINVKHLAATPLDMEVYAVAELIEIDRKRLVFKVEAFDEVEKIGSGLHERFIIDDENFLNKANSKRGK